LKKLLIGLAILATASTYANCNVYVADIESTQEDKVLLENRLEDQGFTLVDQIEEANIEFTAINSWCADRRQGTGVTSSGVMSAIRPNHM